MSTAICPDNEIALFSADGKHWFDRAAPDQRRPISWEANENVTKVVIGSLEEEDDEEWEDEERDDEDDNTADEQALRLSIPDDLASIFPNLTHLHLWQIRDLTDLPRLPEKLRCLDIRGCSQLTTLPAVPNTLCELDLGGCAALSRLPTASLSLERLFLNDCAALEDDYLAAFWLDISGHEDAPQLIEFDGSRCPAVTSLKRIPRSVTRLVLEGCENLSDVSQLAEFTQLTHLNLSACPKLTEIPDIPDDLQYVQLHDSDDLTRFMGQDIGPYDRGDSDRPNVAKTLYSRRKFGHELVASAHAKLLLLGDGRVGKSTLAKRLQWETLTPEQQDDLPHLRPRKDEPFTHKVRFARWETRFQLSEDDAAALNQRAGSAGLASPCDVQHTLPGSVRVWDFGGQEIYHQTHRLFASEGSVFLILWTAKPLDESEIKAHKPPQLRVSDEEWQEWNRTRSLDYWLEYVQSIRPTARIALVCTRVRKGEPHPPWTELAPQHASDDIPCFYIDSLEDACPQNPEYQKLVNFVHRACADEARRIGILQPAYYAEVAAYVDHLLGENEAARTNPRQKPEHLLVPYPSWAARIVERHRQIGDSQQELSADDVGTITGYLHDAGQVFHLRDPAHPAILIDQEWATDVIYKIIRPDLEGEVCLFNVIRDRGGHFDERVLQDDPHWQALSHDVERQQILSYMQQCGIIVRIQSGDHSWDRSDHYLATEKWLLPEYAGDLETTCKSIYGKVLQRSRGEQIEQFSFGQQKINEFDFRGLMAHLGNILGTRATWFRNGLQAVDDFQDPRWCFQLHWTPADETGFLGHVTARLTCPGNIRNRMVAQVEQHFALDGSPFARRMGHLKREALAVDDQSHYYFRDSRDSDFDLAISSSGADRDMVRQLVDVLKAEGIRVFWYRLTECRADENAKVMKFMEGLRNPQCSLLVLSDSYLKNDPEQNWYCPWELADAILRIQDGRRSIQQTLVAYVLGGQLNSNNVDDIAVKVLGDMSDYYDEKYHAVSRADKDTFRYYRDWSDHFRNSVKPEAMGRFFQERGTLGTYSQYEQKADGTFDFSGLVSNVRSALGWEQNV